MAKPLELLSRAFSKRKREPLLGVGELAALMRSERSLGAALSLDAADLQRLVDLAGANLRVGRVADARTIIEGLIALEPEVPVFRELLVLCEGLDTARDQAEDR
jgi:hypothetical protein